MGGKSVEELALLLHRDQDRLSMKRASKSFSESGQLSEIAGVIEALHVQRAGYPCRTRPFCIRVCFALSMEDMVLYSEISFCSCP